MTNEHDGSMKVAPSKNCLPIKAHKRQIFGKCDFVRNRRQMTSRQMTDDVLSADAAILPSKID